MMIFLAIALPLLAGLFSFFVPPRLGLWLNALSAFASLGIACALGFMPGQIAFYGYLRADGLAVVLAVVSAAAAGVAGLTGVRFFLGPDGPTHDARRYAVVAPLVLAALLCTSFSDHLGLMWISMELSAVSAVVLVALHGNRTTLEAAFKYMMLGSAGLVLSLLGTALVYGAGVPALGEGDAALSFRALKAAGPALSPQMLRLGFVLAAIGYGCKVGLFPLHVWKPDAYSAAPAPVAGLLAGAAVSVPLGALLRFGSVAAAGGQRELVETLYLGAGLLSIVAAAFFSVRERDLRRVLAFTSVEHMGLCLLACGLASEGVRGGLMHLVSNGVLKALAFGLLGFVAAERGGAGIDRGPGLFGRSSGLAFVFLVVIAASVGFPPFGIFASELTVLRAVFGAGHVALGLVVLLALGAVFGVLFSGALRLLFSRSDEPLPEGAPRHGRYAMLIAVPALVLLAALGAAMPQGLFEWLGAVAREIG